MILSIESSCDDSSLAITQIADYRIIFHKKVSQELEHSKFGGVVPELASRLHATTLPLILQETIPYFPHLKAICVTTEPGLNVTLLEGAMMARTLAYSLNLPLIAINHLKGHIYSLFLEKKSQLPLGILLVSGGHTLIAEAFSLKDIKIVATTLDDSFGESFDKLAKMLDLGYPGGPIVEQLAKEGSVDSFKFTLPLRRKSHLAFSFSGLKNAARLFIQEQQTKGEVNRAFIANLCASFQACAIKHLLQKCETYLKASTLENFGLVGGASANVFLRTNLERLCQKYHKNLLLAPLEFCSDNAAMIGRVGIESYLQKDFCDPLTLETSPRTTQF